MECDRCGAFLVEARLTAEGILCVDRVVCDATLAQAEEDAALGAFDQSADRRRDVVTDAGKAAL